MHWLTTPVAREGEAMAKRTHPLNKAYGVVPIVVWRIFRPSAVPEDRGWFRHWHRSLSPCGHSSLDFASDMTNEDGHLGQGKV
jgi:hypothetical protein